MGIQVTGIAVTDFIHLETNNWFVVVVNNRFKNTVWINRTGMRIRCRYSKTDFGRIDEYQWFGTGIPVSSFFNQDQPGPLLVYTQAAVIYRQPADGWFCIVCQWQSKQHRVPVNIIIGFSYFKMRMRALAAACIAAI